jgi:hypothetical protein
VVDETACHDEILTQARHRLKEEFDLTQTTLQLESAHYAEHCQTQAMLTETHTEHHHHHHAH